MANIISDFFFGRFQQCAYMLFYKRIFVASRDASNTENSNMNGGLQDATEKDVHNKDGEDGYETDDDFMVYGHNDVAWTGMV